MTTKRKTSGGSLHEKFIAGMKRRRAELRLTQDEVAARMRGLGARTSRAQICESENGRHVPRLAMIEKIAKALGIRPSEMLDGE